MIATDKDQALREHLLDVLRGGNAHIGFDKAVAGFPEDLRGKRPPHAPYSGWELLEHMRLAQWDIVAFSLDKSHVSPDWPSGYWPRTPEPPDRHAWKKSIDAFHGDLEAMENLVSDPATDLYARIPWGDGQTILREALLLADHNAYHLGQLVVVRKLLGAWK